LIVRTNSGFKVRQRFIIFLRFDFELVNVKRRAFKSQNSLLFVFSFSFFEFVVEKSLYLRDLN
jgi:hypothetical protein